MFIELTAEWGALIMVNLNNVSTISKSSVITFVSGSDGCIHELTVKESYEEIKLKMAGR